METFFGVQLMGIFMYVEYYIYIYIILIDRQKKHRSYNLYTFYILFYINVGHSIYNPYVSRVKSRRLRRHRQVAHDFQASALNLPIFQPGECHADVFFTTRKTHTKKTQGCFFLC